MINDIFNDLEENIQFSLYAGDGAMWLSCVQIEQGLRKMQQAINTIGQWCKLWGFNLTATKTKALIFSRARKFLNLSLKLQTDDIEFVTNYKFLGVILGKHLTWGPYIKRLCEQCEGDLRILAVLSGRRWGAKYDSLKKVYNALILSKLNYAYLIYDTAARSHLLSLDRIQYAAARMILGAMKCTPVAYMEAEANMLPLYLTRKQCLTKYAARILG